MSITHRTRKLLWTKAANRCSICKIKLFSNEEDSLESNIGEECHIISSKTGGPRYKENIDDYDEYVNLILLCRNDHRKIDELTDTFTEEILRYMKLNHENWVQSTIDKAIKNEKMIKPKFLKRITSGKEFLNIISGSHGYRINYDEVTSEIESDYIAGVLQELVDCIDISDIVDVYETVKMGFNLTILIKELEDNGYYLFVENGIQKMKFVNGEIDNWSIITLIVLKADNPEIINFDLNKGNDN